MGSPAPVALLAGSFGVRFPGLGFCQWSGRPCACCPGPLRAVRGFCLVDGSLSAGFWLGLQVSSPSFHSPRPRSLSLSLFRPFLLQPLAPGAFLVGACVCLGYLRSLGCPSPSPGGIPVGIPSFLYSYLPVALSHLPGGVQLFCFPLAPFQSVLLVCPGRWLIFLALSSACRQVIDRRLLSSLWFGWCSATFPAALHLASTLWPVGCSTVSSLRACSCVLSWTLGFSIPLPITSSWAPVSRFLSSAASSSPRYSRWRLDPAFLLLWCASSYSLSRLVSCFCFLGRLFRALSRFPRFSLLIF